MFTGNTHDAAKTDDMARDSIGRRMLMGAKLGAVRCGLVWICVDVGGPESLSFRAVWTDVDGCGHGLEIYESEGWGFESFRASWETFVLAGDFWRGHPMDPSDVWEPFLVIPMIAVDPGLPIDATS